MLSSRFQDALHFIQTQGVAGSARTVKDTTYAQASGLFDYFRKGKYLERSPVYKEPALTEVLLASFL